MPLHAFGFALALFAALCFSASDAVGRYAMTVLGYDGSFVLALLFLGALLPLSLYIHAGQQWSQLRPRQPLLVVLRALCACAELWLVYETFKQLSLAQSYTLFFTMPLWVALLSWPLLGEKLGLRQGLALLVGFVGVIIAVNPQADSLSLGHLTGLAAALAMTGGYLFMRKLSATESTGTLLLAFVGSICLFNILRVDVWPPAPLLHVVLLLGGGAFMGCGNICLLNALKRVPAPLVAPFQYSQIIWALVFGWFVFADKPNAATLAGATVIIVAGILLTGKTAVPPKENGLP